MRDVDSHPLRVRKRYILFRTACTCPQSSFTLSSSSAHPDVCTKTLSATNFSIFGIYEVTFGISGVSEKLGIIPGISGYLAGKFTVVYMIVHVPVLFWPRISPRISGGTDCPPRNGSRPSVLITFGFDNNARRGRASKLPYNVFT